PATPSIVYTGTDVGIFKSTDGGQNWIAANGGLGTTSQVNALAIDPASSTTLYAATQAGLFKTINGAASWTPIDLGVSGLSARGITIDPTSHRTLYAGVDDLVGDVNSGVLKSTDGGATWTRIYRSTPYEDGGAASVTALLVDPA